MSLNEFFPPLGSAPDAEAPVNRWGALHEKDFERDQRRELAQRVVVRKLSAGLRTSAQLRRLEEAPRRAGESFEFAVLGDAEPGRFWIFRKLFNKPGVFERQLRSVQAHPIDFSVQLGDMVSRGILRNYARFFKDLERVGVAKPYLTVIGNHDRLSPHHRSNAHLYTAAFGPTNYSFDRGGVRFVSLDTSAHGLTRRQLKWLDRVLDCEGWKVVFTHIPPAPLKRWTDFGPTKGIGGFRPGAAEFVEITSRRRVNRVYMGHIHGFGVQDYRGVRYVLTGGGGSPLFPSGVNDKFHHYIVVRAGADGLRETVHSLDGRRFHIPAGRVLFSA